MPDNAEFKHSNIPMINIRSINASTDDLGGFYLSYNPNHTGYGCDTTAIVLNECVFFILNGNHKAQLLDAFNRDGFQGVIDYFIDNLAQASHRSEHYSVVNQERSVLPPSKTVLELLGKTNIERMAQAIQVLSNKSA